MINKYGQYIPAPDAERAYADIIHLPHHEPSPRHPRMSREKRAAQFAPVNMVPIPAPGAQDLDDYGDWGDWYGDQTAAGWCSLDDDWYPAPR